MKNNRLVQFYDRLTAEERFRGVLDAMARGDHEEMRRLEEACPRRIYRMTDADYLDLIDASRRAATAFTILWQDAERRVTLYRAVKSGIRAVKPVAVIVGRRAARRAASEEDPIWQVCCDTVGHLDTLHQEAKQGHRKAVAELKGVYAGFLRFCQAADVEPERLLAWYGPVWAAVKKTAALRKGDIPADKKIADRVYQRFCQGWPGLGVTASGANGGRHLVAQAQSGTRGSGHRRRPRRSHAAP